MPAPVAKFIIAPRLAEFMQQYPEISLEISVGTPCTDIVAGRFDAGFNRGDYIPRDMVAVRISDNIRYVAVASPEYLKLRDRPRAPAELLGHNCIRYRLPDGNSLPWKFRGDGEEFEVDVEGPLQVNDATLAISAALDGFGVAYVVEDYVRGAIAQGRLVALFDADRMPAEDAFFMFYPSRRQHPAALRVLIEFLKSNVARTSDIPRQVEILESQFELAG
jgi:DNA-binding transcriptional LysR family regulator